MTDQQPASMPSARDIEQALRGAGLSRRQAKAVCAEGIRALDGVVEQDDEHDDADLARLLAAAAGALRRDAK